MRTRKLVRFALLATVLSIGVSPVRAADVVTGHHFIDAAAMKPSKFNFATTYAIQAGELRNIATVAELIVRSAALRPESRGLKKLDGSCSESKMTLRAYGHRWRPEFLTSSWRLSSRSGLSRQNRSSKTAGSCTPNRPT